MFMLKIVIFQVDLKKFLFDKLELVVNKKTL